MTGTIKTLTGKGFGFIAPDDADENTKDLFFHANDVVDAKFDDLSVGDAVSFEPVDTDKGQNATEVTRV